MTSRGWRMVLTATAAIPAALLIGFLFPAFHHPIALAASPFIGIGLVLAGEGWSRRRVLVAIGLGLVLMVAFLISPTYLGRLF